MNAKRVFLGIVGAMVLALGVGVATIVVGNGQLQKRSAALINLKLESRALDEQQAALVKAKQDIIKYTPLNDIAQKVVPQDKDQALTVRELVALAGQAGIKIGGITFPASNLGQKKVAGASAKDALTQVVPVTGISGVYQLPITLQSDVTAPITYAQLVGFLHALENNRHTAQVSQLSITPADSSGKRLSFELVVNVYLKP